ncbi:MAG: glycosyltransferase family 4 protein [Flavobacteriales bacterium]
MKVLQVHNYYQQPGGEDTVVAEEAMLMRSKGWKVLQYLAHNDSLKSMSSVEKVASVTGTFWSKKHYDAIRKQLRTERPDICHVHNFFPLISPSVFDACKDENIPVIMTAHNYRLMCANGLFLRNGMACEECLASSMLHSIKYGCYRDSRAQTSAVAFAMEWHHRKNTWNKSIDKIIALSEFMKQKMISKGVSASKILIKPNFIAVDRIEHKGPRTQLLFIGRLDKIKGADLLLHVANAFPNRDIKVLGDGELRAALSGKPNIELLGQQPKSVVLNEISKSYAVILPTRFYEGMPMTVIESFSQGTPVITSNHGALPEIVSHGNTGWLFTPNDPKSLIESVHSAFKATDSVESMRISCFEEYMNKYSPEVNFSMLKAIYEHAIG